MRALSTTFATEDMRPSVIAAAGITLVAATYTWFDTIRESIGVVEPVVRPRSGVSALPADGYSASANRYLIDRAEWIGASADPFVPKQPPVQPPAIAPLPPPPKPVAPPLPYRYFGRMTAPDGTAPVFLAKDNQIVPIKVGDTLDGTYKVESVTDGQIVLVFLPIGEKVLINLPSAQGPR